MIQEAVLLTVAPAVLCALLEGFSRAASGIAWAMGAPASFLITLGLWLGLCLMISGFRSFRLRWVLTSTFGLLASLLGIANRYKMRYRIEPVLFTDLYQLGDAAQTVRHMEFSINLTELSLVLFAFVALAVAGVLLVKNRREKRRIVLPVLGLALLIALPPLCTFERIATRTRYDLVDVARTEGTLYTALAVENQRRSLLRVDYDEADVRAQYRALMDDVPAANGREPNIIFVLSESFTDEQWLSQYVDFTRELTPFYNQLITTCQSGRVTVPKVGGGTSETEFEVLTGLRSQYAINPYAMGLPPMNSVASILRGRGYVTSAIHWYSGVYYNRYNNLCSLGFTDFYTTDTTRADFTHKGMFICDEAHYASALAQLRRTEERDFVFLLTMQNHGGYGYDDFRQTYGADTPFTNAYCAETEKILSNYCWLLGQSDRSLEQFLTELSAFPEETIVVFFGDHIAPFGENAYAELGVDLTAASAKQTPYFIWSNRGNVPAVRDLYAWQLGAEALRFAGLDTDPFLHYANTLTAPGDERHDLLSYDALFGAQYAYDEASLSPESETFRIGGEMVLTGFDAAVIADAVYLRPQLENSAQKYALSINGEQFGTQWVYAANGEMDIACVMNGFSGENWNQSNTLHFDSAAQLLQHSGEWPYESIAIDFDSLTCVQSRWHQAYTLWKTKPLFPTGRHTALTVSDKRWVLQPVYGLTQPDQYAIDENGCLWMAVKRGQTPDDIDLHIFN
ncbi:MAG: LTA synthase family protein [Clostridia bacterium]|nr:LTA synthase family protein [Clostridia bacterium]